MTAAIVPPPAAPDTGPAPTDLDADLVPALLLAASIAFILHLLSVVGRVLVPNWPTSPLLPAVGFVLALVAFYRHRWTRVYRPFGSRLPIYLAELILLLVLTRLASLAVAPQRLLERLPGWWAEPLTIIDAAFAVDALFVAGAWLAGHVAGAAIDQMHVQPGEVAPPRGSAAFAQWERSQAAFDHRGAQWQLTNLVVAGTAVVVVALALLALGRPAASALTEALVTAGLAVVCGLILLGWAHVTLLDTLWRLDGQTAPSLLSRRWAGWLLVVVVGVGLVAFLVPRTYAVDPLALVLWVLAVLTGLFQVLLFLVLLPFVWLASLFGIGAGGVGQPAPPPVLPTTDRVETDWSLLAALRSLGFWFAIAALTVYALRTLFQSRWGVLRYLPRIGVWSTLQRLWRALVDGLRERAGTLAAMIRASTAGRSPIGGALRRRDHAPRPTDPRGLVLFLYLSLVDRAGRRGLPRRRGMTAAEYSRFLAVRLAADPAADGSSSDAPQLVAIAELDTLTAAFLEARYSRHPVGEGEVGRARRALQRLLQLIRQRQVHRRSGG